MLPKVFIDGRTGTTGLRIYEWMTGREDIELLTLPSGSRRSSEHRRDRILKSDVTILCLPDEAAQEVAYWVDESGTRLIDASTAHRVAEGWVYGLPELAPGQREAIGQAKYVSNPGCYPTGFLLLVRPLIDAGLLSEGRANFDQCSVRLFGRREFDDRQVGRSGHWTGSTAL